MFISLTSVSAMFNKLVSITLTVASAVLPPLLTKRDLSFNSMSRKSVAWICPLNWEASCTTALHEIPLNWKSSSFEASSSLNSQWSPMKDKPPQTEASLSSTKRSCPSMIPEKETEAASSMSTLSSWSTCTMARKTELLAGYTFPVNPISSWVPSNLAFR